MNNTYSPLASATLGSGATLHRPAQALPEQVTLDSPAVDVMTDLKVVTGVTVDPMVSIDAAQERMRQYGVRLLLVMDHKNELVGLITTTDILGEKPMQVIQTRGGTRGEILVRDIMTPQEKLEVLSMSDVQHAKVGNVVATLRASGRQHALVADKGEPGSRQVVRGILSASQLAKSLGTPIHTADVARTFAEIEGSLSK
jgi:CBS-domain-containing membrane protein